MRFNFHDLFCVPVANIRIKRTKALFLLREQSTGSCLFSHFHNSEQYLKILRKRKHWREGFCFSRLAVEQIETSLKNILAVEENLSQNLSNWDVWNCNKNNKTY